VYTDRTKVWQMYSLRVDEAWHQFILFTREYMRFCRQFFNAYVPHAPSNAPKTEEGRALPIASFSDFGNRYQELFGTPLPDVWFDPRAVTIKRRALNDFPGGLTLAIEDDSVSLLGPRGKVVLSVSSLAKEAMSFIVKAGSFYVRELPGGLTDEEKVALVSTLVAAGVLRVGA
jgi:hypothetical protein